MFDTSKIDEMLNVAKETHSKATPNSIVSLQTQRVLNAKGKGTTHSLIRSKELISKFSCVQPKVFEATHPLVPPVL